MRRLTPILGLLATLPPGAAEAYIGPGLGAGTVAAVLGIVAAFGMALVALVWYPVKRVFKRRKPDSDPENAS